MLFYSVHADTQTPDQDLFSCSFHAIISRFRRVGGIPRYNRGIPALHGCYRVPGLRSQVQCRLRLLCIKVNSTFIIIIIIRSMRQTDECRHQPQSECAISSQFMPMEMPSCSRSLVIVCQPCLTRSSSWSSPAGRNGAERCQTCVCRRFHSRHETKEYQTSALYKRCMAGQFGSGPPCWWHDRAIFFSKSNLMSSSLRILQT